jgi:hypothetical protein
LKTEREGGAANDDLRLQLHSSRLQSGVVGGDAPLPF